MYKKALTHFKTIDPLLYQIAKSIDPIVLQSAPNPFIRLVRAIVGQQLSVKAASTIFSRFEKLFKKEINAKDILKLADDDIRACGISYPKIKYIKDLSQKVINKEIILETLNTKTNEEIIEHLIQVKGIGVWSAEMFMMFSLAREDIFSAGDLGIYNAMKKLYGKDFTKEEMTKKAQVWSPYRTYACLLLWRSLDNSPK